MLSKSRIATHPGEVLLKEFLASLGITQVALAEHIEISLQRINEIVRGKRDVTPETAWQFSWPFVTTPEFWLDLQAQYDLVKSRPRRVIGKLRRAS